MLRRVDVPRWQLPVEGVFTTHQRSLVGGEHGAGAAVRRQRQQKQICQRSRRRCRRTSPEAVRLPCLKDSEHDGRTTEMKHATAVRGNMLVVADARADVVAEFIVATTEAFG